jgi:hypothetical protein
VGVENRTFKLKVSHMLKVGVDAVFVVVVVVVVVVNVADVNRSTSVLVRTMTEVTYPV